MESTIRAMFAPASGTTYLDTATYGLPPEPTRRVLADALDAWSAGTASWQDDWDKVGEGARGAFARIVGVDAARVALISSTSTGVGVIAADLSTDDSVVVPADDFTSILFPLLVARDRGVAVREVAFERLVDAITPGTTLVATSLVQMQTGRTAPIAAIVERAREVGARVLLDGSQGLPLVPLGDLVDEIDYIVACGYKHFLSPRGVAFMVLRPDRIGLIPPILANWRSADRPYDRFFGGPLTLAPDAAMYDVSLAWFPWLGAATSLGLLAEWQRFRRHGRAPRSRKGARSRTGGAMGRQQPRGHADRRRRRGKGGPDERRHQGFVPGNRHPPLDARLQRPDRCRPSRDRAPAGRRTLAFTDVDLGPPAPCRLRA